MKKVLNKNTIFGIIIWIIISCVEGVGATTFLYSLNQISYVDKDVESALDNLYIKGNELTDVKKAFDEKDKDIEKLFAIWKKQKAFN